MSAATVISTFIFIMRLTPLFNNIMKKFFVLTLIVLLTSISLVANILLAIAFLNNKESLSRVEFESDIFKVYFDEELLCEYSLENGVIEQVEICSEQGWHFFVGHYNGDKSAVSLLNNKVAETEFSDTVRVESNIVISQNISSLKEFSGTLKNLRFYKISAPLIENGKNVYLDSISAESVLGCSLVNSCETLDVKNISVFSYLCTDYVIPGLFSKVEGSLKIDGLVLNSANLNNIEGAPHSSDTALLFQNAETVLIKNIDVKNVDIKTQTTVALLGCWAKSIELSDIRLTNCEIDRTYPGENIGVLVCSPSAIISASGLEFNIVTVGGIEISQDHIYENITIK